MTVSYTPKHSANLLRLTTIWFAVCMLVLASAACSAPEPGADATGWPRVATPGCPVTHGPMLGRVTDSTIRVWLRTDSPREFRVAYWEHPAEGNPLYSPFAETRSEDDNTGWVELTGLKPATKYDYALSTGETLINSSVTPGVLNSFRTLPSSDLYRDLRYNPEGVFNVAFEVGCGNKQRYHPEVPVYGTMLRQLKDKIHFQIMNGDFLYEDHPDGGGRNAKNNSWLRTCENYRYYLERSQNLANFHREIPATFMFDDHEILNDLWGAGTPGLKDGFWLWRDIGIRAFYDYLGWANYGEETTPGRTAGSRLIFGKGKCAKGDDVLEDRQFDFSQLELSLASTLLIGRKQENAGVYTIQEVIDKDHIRLSHPCSADEQVDYSIGTEHYHRFKVSNAEFFVTDTRTNRTAHDNENVYSDQYSLLGERQRRWLIDGVSHSKARFIFLVSTVNWMFDHVNPQRPKKGESYSSYAWERDLLLDAFDKLDKHVFILSGDLHTSYVAQISDNIWEFASGPHNSDNHAVSDSTYYPGGGSLTSHNKKVKVKWCSRFVDELLPPQGEGQGSRRSVLHFPIYCVIQVNNAYKNYDFREDQERWLAFDHPQVVVSYYNGYTGDLLYSEGVSTADLWPIGEAPAPKGR